MKLLVSVFCLFFNVFFSDLFTGVFTIYLRGGRESILSGTLILLSCYVFGSWMEGAHEIAHEFR